MQQTVPCRFRGNPKQTIQPVIEAKCNQLMEKTSSLIAAAAQEQPSSEQPCRDPQAALSQKLDSQRRKRHGQREHHHEWME